MHRQGPNRLFFDLVPITMARIFTAPYLRISGLVQSAAYGGIYSADSYPSALRLILHHEGLGGLWDYFQLSISAFMNNILFYSVKVPCYVWVYSPEQCACISSSL
jgi:hypothetical protein